MALRSTTVFSDFFVPCVSLGQPDTCGVTAGTVCDPSGSASAGLLSQVSFLLWCWILPGGTALRRGAGLGKLRRSLGQSRHKLHQPCAVKRRVGNWAEGRARGPGRTVKTIRPCAPLSLQGLPAEHSLTSPL